MIDLQSVIGQLLSMEKNWLVDGRDVCVKLRKILFIFDLMLVLKKLCYFLLII